MRRCAFLFAFILLTSSVLTLPAAADTRYVSDELVITLRYGKSTQHKIIRTLKSGTPLEVLEEDKSYLKVRTTDGIEGYVLRQYITSEPPKTLRIEELERVNSSLQDKITSLEEIRSKLEMQLNTVEDAYKQELSALRAENTDMEQNLELAVNNERIMAEKYDALLAQADNVIEIAAERDQLLQRNNSLEADAAALLKKNEKLSDSRMIKWFLAGGGVFFLGWIIGKISRKKRSRF